MTKSMRAVAATLTLTLTLGSVLLVSACGSGGSNETTSSSTTSSPTSLSSSVPSSSTSSAVADPNSPQARSGAMVDQFFAVSSRCLFDPQKTPMTCFDSVAVGSELTDLRNELSSAKTAYTKQIGSTRVVWAKRLKVDLTNKPKETPPTIPIVTYSVCYDVSKVNIVDYQGKSIVPPNRKPRGIVTVAVANYHYPSPAGWRVAYEQSTGKTC